MLTVLHDSFGFGSRTRLGVIGGLARERLARPKYWILTQDGKLRYCLMFMWIGYVNDVVRSLESGLEEEGKGGERPNLVDVRKGAICARVVLY